MKIKGLLLFVTMVFLSSIVMMYATIHIYFYLDGLTFLKSAMIGDIAGYKIFLHKIYNAGMSLSVIFALAYMYAMVSFMYHSARSQQTNIDPVLINLFYFVLLWSSLKYNNYDADIVLYFALLAVLPIIIFVYFISKKLYLKIKSKKNISIRILQILLFSFLVENFNNIYLSYQLASSDMKEKLVQRTFIKAEAEKKKILKKVNDLSNKKLLMYRDNEDSIHIVIKNEI